MELGLKHRVAVVPAASQGLGRATALELAREGACVAICSRNGGEVERTAAEIQAQTGAEVIAVRADVSVAADIERLIDSAVQKWGAVDILVANAGGPPAGDFMEFDDEAWEQAFRLTLLSVVRLYRAVIPDMKKRGWGRIINITSTSVKQPIDELVLSNSIRPGVIGLAKTLALHLAPFGITINNVCPGRILTQRTYDVACKRAQQEGIPVEEIIRGHAKNIPMQRMGTPEELAALIAFLASERASYITGTTIPVDGGIVRAIM